MLDLNRKHEGFGNEAIQKRTKKPLLLRKENSNRTFQPARQHKNPTTPHSFLYVKKRIPLQKAHCAPELKNAKKNIKKTSIVTLKYSRPPSIGKEIEEIENSICCLRKKIEEQCRKESNSETEASSESPKTEQILPESCSTGSSINCKLKNNHKDFSKQKLGKKNKVVTDISSSHKHKYNNEHERSRIKSSLEPIRTLTADNITGMLSVSNKHFQNGMGSRKLKKIYDRLDRVREFIRNINAMEMRPSTCSDGINHKDTPQKKNKSSDPDEEEDAKGNDHYKTIQQIVKNRRIINKNRMFASIPPLLSTVIEEPEKEEEEAKLYEML